MIKRERGSRRKSSWFGQNWQYFVLMLVAVVTVFLVALALTRPDPMFSPSSRTPIPSASSSTSVPTPSATPPTKVVAFLGDSYTAGAGASTGTTRWTTALAQENAWTEINLGAEGTGYSTAGAGEPYLERVDSVIAAGPSAVIVSGGRFDYSGSSSPAEVSAAISETFTAIRAGLPQAQIIALGPIWDATEAPGRLDEIAIEIRAAVEAVGGTFVDIGQPLADQPSLLVDDGIVPNDDGYATLRSIIGAAVTPLISAVK